MALAFVGLMAMVVTGSYRSVERVALFFGLFEIAFLAMAWRAAPGVAPIVARLRAPPRDPEFLYLLAANLGTSVIPWALLYQQSASVDKGLETSALRRRASRDADRRRVLSGHHLRRWSSPPARRCPAGSLDTVGGIETAFTATLGTAFGHVVFIFGLTGSALTATIVVCLTLAWAIGETFGVGRSLEQSPAQAPWFYGAMAAMLAAGGALVASGINLVSLTVAAGVVNALLLPIVLAVLYVLGRKMLPDELKLRGAYAFVVAAAFCLVGGVGLYAGIAGLF